jgi:DNA-directed RNA polymerase specialized sigma24 family protein
MAIPKWTDERTATLTNFVGAESPVTYPTVVEAADQLETSPRSVASKLRKMGHEVESSASVTTRAFTEAQEATLNSFVVDNAGTYTYGQIAEAFEDGEFSSKQIQGKLLSMQLTEHVKKQPKAEAIRSFTPEEEATFVAHASDGAFLEDIAEALGRTVNQVRGKALSLLRQGSISSIPAQKESKAASRVDPLDGVDVAGLSVEEIAEQIGKTARGVKTMLTRRGLTASNYDGAAKAAKAAG